MKNRRAKTTDVMGGYKYLRAHQIKARLEEFKKRNCQDCKSIEDCGYDTYAICKDKK